MWTGCMPDCSLPATGSRHRHATRNGATVRVAARRPGDVRIATQSANAPEIIQADLLDEVSVGRAVAGADAVFNPVGILTEIGPQTYRAIHVDGARRVALAARRHGV